MEMTNDKQFDDLMRESFLRQDIIIEINANVMRSVGKASRKAKAKRLLRLVTACAAIALMLLLPAVALMQPQGIALSMTTIATAAGLLFFYIPIVHMLNRVL